MSTTVLYFSLAALVGTAVFVTTFDTACESTCAATDESAEGDSNELTTTVTEATTKSASSCKAGCCATKSTPIDYRLADNKKENLTCTLTGNDFKQRRQLTQELLIQNAQKIIELDNGYRFLYSADDDEFVRGLVDWVIAEKKCCSFFKFSLTIEPNGPLTFELTGPSGAKEIMDGFVQKNAETLDE